MGEQMGIDAAIASLEEDDDGAEETTATAPMPRARARKVDPIPEEDTAVDLDVSPFGQVPAMCTHWGIRRSGVSSWEVLAWGPPGSNVESREWAIGTLSVAEVLSRWGEGQYQVQWLAVTPRGGRKHLNYGRVVKLKKPEQAPAGAPHAVAPPNPMGESFMLAMQIMKMIGNESDAKVQGYASMAQLFAGKQQNGLGAAELQLILQNQAAQNERAIAAAVAAAVTPLQKQIAEMSEGEDDDGSPVSDAVRAAAPLFVKGKGGWAQAANFAAANPELVKTALPIVVGAATALLGLFKAPDPPPAPAVPAAPQIAPRPRAVAPSPSPVVQNGHTPAVVEMANAPTHISPMSMVD